MPHGLRFRAGEVGDGAKRRDREGVYVPPARDGKCAIRASGEPDEVCLRDVSSKQSLLDASVTLIQNVR
jgi:hypothetical protein